MTEKRKLGRELWDAIYENELTDMIKAYRKIAGLTQQELAVRSGISPSHLCALEQGHHDPQLGMLIAICDALDNSSSIPPL